MLCPLMAECVPDASNVHPYFVVDVLLEEQEQEDVLVKVLRVARDFMADALRPVQGCVSRGDGGLRRDAHAAHKGTPPGHQGARVVAVGACLDARLLCVAPQCVCAPNSMPQCVKDAFLASCAAVQKAGGGGCYAYPGVLVPLGESQLAPGVPVAGRPCTSLRGAPLAAVSLLVTVAAGARLEATRRLLLSNDDAGVAAKRRRLDPSEAFPINERYALVMVDGKPRVKPYTDVPAGTRCVLESSSMGGRFGEFYARSEPARPFGGGSDAPRSRGGRLSPAQQNQKGDARVPVPESMRRGEQRALLVRETGFGRCA